MDLDDLIMAWCCVSDEGLQQTLLAGKRLRERGPEPSLAAREVLSREVVGAYLGLEQEAALLASCGRHSCHFFPMLVHLHRTPFTPQATHLQVRNDRLWQWLREPSPPDSWPAPCPQRSSGTAGLPGLPGLPGHPRAALSPISW